MSLQAMSLSGWTVSRSDSVRGIVALDKKIAEFEKKGIKPKIGLVLCGGGALGFAHIGALKIIDSLQIPVDYIVGTSMGGILGGLYSIGYRADELEELATGLNWIELFSDQPKRENLPYFEKSVTGKHQINLRMDGFSPVLPTGLIYGQNINLKLLNLTESYEGVQNFDDFPVPFRCVAADLITAKQVVLSNGSLARALRATMSIPTVFAPVSWGDSLLVDGGVVNNFPVDVVKSMGADIVIGLNLKYPDKMAEDFKSFLDVIDRTVDIPRQAVNNENIRNTDIYIEQDISGYSLGDFDQEKIKGIIIRGDLAIRKKLDKLFQLKKLFEKTKMIFEDEKTITGKKITRIMPVSKNYFDRELFYKILPLKKDDILSKADIVKRVAESNLNSHFKIEDISFNSVSKDAVELTIRIEQLNPPIIFGVNILGNRELDFSFIYNNLGMKPSEPLSINTLVERLRELYNLGYFETISYEIKQRESGFIDLNINIHEKEMSRLSLGFRYDDYYKLVGLLSYETTSFLIPGSRSEIDLQFAGLYRFRAKYSYPSRSLDRPVVPFIFIKNKSIPVNIYSESGDIVALYGDRSFIFGAGLGFQAGKSGYLEVNYAYEKINTTPDVALVIDPGVFPKWNDRLKRIDVSLNIDALDDILVPKRGFMIGMEAEMSTSNLGSEISYSRFEGFFDWYKMLSGRILLKLHGDIQRVWKDIPVYKWFFSGGPQSFVGYDYTQIAGTRFYKIRTDLNYFLKENFALKVVFNSAFDYNLNLPALPFKGGPIYGYGAAVEFNSILGNFQLMFARGYKSIYQRTRWRNLIYFTAGAKF